MFFDNTTNTLFVFEFSKVKLEIDDSKEFTFRNKTLYLSRKNLDILLRLADTTGALTKLDKSKGSFLKFSNYVGVIELRGYRIQVLPKIFDIILTSEASLDLAKRNFARMLEYWIYHVSGVSVNPLELTPQLVEEFNLLEIYAHIFSRKAYELVANQPLREYVRKHNNLIYIKGKIDFKTMAMRSYLKHAIPCIYFDYTRDNLINRAILYTSYYLTRIVKWRKTRNNLNNIIAILRDIKLEPINPHTLEKINFNRLNEPYKPIIELAKILLTNLTPAPIQGTTTSYAFLVPMENVYEGFISQVIKKEFPDIGKIEIQKPIGYLAKNENGKNVFKLRPDIVIKHKNNEVTVIDLKYKKLDPTKQNLGIENTDIYQLYTYLTKLKKKHEKVKGILIYPKYKDNIEEKFQIEIPIQKNNQRTHKTQIKATTIDLTIDMQKEWEKFKHQLKTKLET